MLLRVLLFGGESRPMRICLLSFSGREEPGNCYKSLEYIRQGLKSEAVGSTLLSVNDYKITGCSNCAYECLHSRSSHCPKEDDVGFLYRTIANHDLAIFAVPVYSGAPCSLYFAFNERSQSVFDDSALYERYAKVVKNYIVVGNEDAGGTEALNMVLAMEQNMGQVLLLQSHLYGENSVSGRLIEIPEARVNLKRFVEKILARTS
jgi:multimeric flavodoxin WrbA